jgi:hypothetical protein
MKDALLYAFIGIALIEFVIILLFRNKISNNEINIKRQVQRNRKSEGNIQEYNSQIKTEKKGFFKRLKIKRNGKN